MRNSITSTSLEVYCFGQINRTRSNTWKKKYIPRHKWRWCLGPCILWEGWRNWIMGILLSIWSKSHNRRKRLTVIGMCFLWEMRVIRLMVKVIIRIRWKCIQMCLEISCLLKSWFKGSTPNYSLRCTSNYSPNNKSFSITPNKAYLSPPTPPTPVPLTSPPLLSKWSQKSSNTTRNSHHGSAELRNAINSCHNVIDRY